MAVSWGVGRRRGSDLALLGLWRGLVPTAPIRPLAWEPPYAAGADKKNRKKTKKKKKDLQIQYVNALIHTRKLKDKCSSMKNCFQYWIDLVFSLN